MIKATPEFWQIGDTVGVPVVDKNGKTTVKWTYTYEAMVAMAKAAVKKGKL